VVTETQLDEFCRLLDDFFKRIGEVGEDLLRQRRHKAYSSHLKPLLEEVLKNVRAEDRASELRHALFLAASADSEPMLHYFTREVRFYLDLTAKEDSGGKDEKTLDAAKTIKESLEKWLKRFLTPRIKNLLAILNEILSLLKGGG
jgi:hypothetical protein